MKKCRNTDLHSEITTWARINLVGLIFKKRVSVVINSHNTKGIFEEDYLIFLLFVFFFVNVSIIGQEKWREKKERFRS